MEEKGRYGSDAGSRLEIRSRRNGDMVRGKKLLLIVVSFLSFASGSAVTGAWYETKAVEELVANHSVSDNWSSKISEIEMAWLKSQGLAWAEQKLARPITQAEFLQIALRALDIPETAGAIPKGAENHTAAKTYATAKANGLIDCSCQIKPDEPVTAEEAARFIMLGVNSRENRQVLGLKEAEAWLSAGGSDTGAGQGSRHNQGTTEKTGLLTSEAIHMMLRLEDLVKHEK